MNVETAKKLLTQATCLYNKAAVEVALDGLARQMTEVLAETNPLFVCVLTGGIVTFGQLLTRLTFPLQIDYVHATRYQGNTQGNTIVWKAKPTHDLKNQTVVIIDDVLDAGVTLKAIVAYCQNQHAKAVYTAVLVAKTDTRSPHGLSQADFTGLLVKDQYTVGYGMDCKEYGRNLPGVYAIDTT